SQPQRNLRRMSASSRLRSAAAASAGGTGAASSSASSASTRRKRGRRSGHGQQQLQLQRASKRPRLQDEELSRGSGGYCSEMSAPSPTAMTRVNSSGGSLDDLAAKAELFLGSGAGPSSGLQRRLRCDDAGSNPRVGGLAMARGAPAADRNLPVRGGAAAVTGGQSAVSAAVTKHLRLTKRINFCSGLPFTFLSEQLDDATLSSVLALCPEVTHILDFYPRRILHRAQVGGRRALTYAGILQALKQCKKLKSIEIMDVDLMSRIFATFPGWTLQCVCLNALPKMDCVRYLYLKWVRFRQRSVRQLQRPQAADLRDEQLRRASNAFRATCGVSPPGHWAGRSSLRVWSWSACAFIGGLVEHIVDEMNGESRKTECWLCNKSYHEEIDAGYFLLAFLRLSRLRCLQSSLCKDSLFVAPVHSSPSFPKLGHRYSVLQRTPVRMWAQRGSVASIPGLMTDSPPHGDGLRGRASRRLASLTVSRAPLPADPIALAGPAMPLFEAAALPSTWRKCPCNQPQNRLRRPHHPAAQLEMLRACGDDVSTRRRGCAPSSASPPANSGASSRRARPPRPVQGFFLAKPPARPPCCAALPRLPQPRCSDIRPTISQPQRAGRHAAAASAYSHRLAPSSSTLQTTSCSRVALRRRPATIYRCKIPAALASVDKRKGRSVDFYKWF
uniref:F-box domain-containing protein n=1 Tax=Macrostomum lignano TaxID=282301 RepID=A0A1I8F866_9PLAT